MSTSNHPPEFAPHTDQENPKSRVGRWAFILAWVAVSLSHLAWRVYRHTCSVETNFPIIVISTIIYTFIFAKIGFAYGYLLTNQKWPNFLSLLKILIYASTTWVLTNAVFLLVVLSLLVGPYMSMRVFSAMSYPTLFKSYIQLIYIFIVPSLLLALLIIYIYNYYITHSDSRA